MQLTVQPNALDVVVADLDRFTRGEIVALALNMDANLREEPPIGTPVDVGWARASWLPSVGEPRVVDVDVRKPTPADVAARSVDAQQGLNNVLAWDIGDGPIFDTNNVVYIIPLNSGHSKQSPPGWVQAALELAVRQTESRGANKAARDIRIQYALELKPRPKP